MGKSSNKKKSKAPSAGETKAQEQKTTTNSVQASAMADANVNGNQAKPNSAAGLKLEHFAAVFLRRANELKEEGNRRFQNKDYRGAMEHYEQALRLTPRNHPDRAVFHSNRAACLLQMKPVQYEAVVRECTLALEVNPSFSRALLRRARALEALGKLEYALQDALLLLQYDGNNPDAIELVKRIRTSIRNRQESSNEKPHSTSTLHKQESSNEKLNRRTDTSPLTPPMPSQCAITSPTSLGASVVNGTPIGTKGPAGSKSALKKKGSKMDQLPKVSITDARRSSPPGIDSKQVSSPASISATVDLSDHLEVHSKDDSTMKNDILGGKSNNLVETTNCQANQSLVTERNSNSNSKQKLHVRPLKLVYDHDIRRAQMPIKCSYREMRELVRKCFPFSKSVLIKYKDEDGDLMTITSTEELRVAVEIISSRSDDKMIKDLEPIRLYVVDVPPEQEPIVEDENEELNAESVAEDSENSFLAASKSCHESISNNSESQSSIAATKTININERVSGEMVVRNQGDEITQKDVEMDDWLLDFAQLFRTHIGVDPDGHVDLHELGMELCSEALEETLTSDEAQPLFEAAACKFQEVAALAFFNWGNVHMCAARKRIPLDGNSNEAEFKDRLQAAYDWAHGQYEQARMKYEDALRVKPDFYEGVLALGQESFESAKLQWSLAIATRVDLTNWDSSKVLELFKNAEHNMLVAVGMWEKLKEQRLEESKVASPAKKNVVSKVESQGNGYAQAMSDAETQEQFMAMGLQINLFWGNILFEHSQVEYKLDLPTWKALLDEAVHKFEMAGATPADIAVVLKNHVSNFTCSCEASKPARQMCNGAADHTEHAKKHSAEVEELKS